MEELFTHAEYEQAKLTDKLPVKCQCCQSPFVVLKHDIYKARKKISGCACKFCSKKCQHISMNKKIEVNCKQCQKTFKKEQKRIKENNFCSHSCSAIYNNSRKKFGIRQSKLEKWLEQELPQQYPNLEFHFARKDAINSELDIYIPQLKLAFELNGICHYEPIYGPDTLSKVKSNDNRKFQACLEHEIELCLINVSSLSYFKPANALKYKNIITTIIDRVTDGVRSRKDSIHSRVCLPIPPQSPSTPRTGFEPIQTR